MSAKVEEASSIQEIYDIVLQTQSEIEEIGFTEEAFKHPRTAVENLIAEGIMNRVLRITEEVGHLSESVSQEYGFERRGAVGVRNRLAHAYGEVDRQIIWDVVSNDFDALLAGCLRYCDDRGIDLE